MLAVASIELEARKPAANRLRRWQLDLGKDLLGAWVAEVRFGRIGSRGRLLRRVFVSEDEALAYMRRCLRRRATAPMRIGVSLRPLVGRSTRIAGLRRHRHSQQDIAMKDPTA